MVLLLIIYTEFFFCNRKKSNEQHKFTLTMVKFHSYLYSFNEFYFYMTKKYIKLQFKIFNKSNIPIVSLLVSFVASFENIPKYLFKGYVLFLVWCFSEKLCCLLSNLSRKEIHHYLLYIIIGPNIDYDIFSICYFSRDVHWSRQRD